VIDELAGQWIACAFVCFGRLSIPAFLAAFLLFRLFDIWKPWPVSWAERRFAGGLGVMLDDVLAGLIAGALAGAAHYFRLL
jgi:phosphatidylglycerophosphatase A